MDKNILKEVFGNISTAEMLKAAAMDATMGAIINGIDDTVDEYEKKYEGISEREYDALTGIITLVAACYSEGMAKGVELLNALAEIAESGEGDMVLAFRELCEAIAKESCSVALNFPENIGISDFYKASEREQMIFRINGTELDDAARRKLAKELGVSEAVINAGEIVLGSKSQCDDIINAVKNGYDSSIERKNYIPNREDDSGVNDMLEAARKAKAERG